MVRLSVPGNAGQKGPDHEEEQGCESHVNQDEDAGYAGLWPASMGSLLLSQRPAGGEKGSGAGTPLSEEMLVAIGEEKRTGVVFRHITKKFPAGNPGRIRETLRDPYRCAAVACRGDERGSSPDLLHE